MDKIDELLTRGVNSIYPSKDELAQVLRSAKKIKLYQGFDPTGSQLHLGHMIGLVKMRQFQKLGHKVIFLIGDGTGQAGDPSGKTSTRNKFYTRLELRKNAADYVKQARSIVKFDGDNPAEILYNGDWLTILTLTDLLELFGRFSVQQLLERDIFQKRIAESKTISLREFIYPILQGYDSVAMNIDLEIGGTDQTFNMLTGRELVREILHKEKFVMTLPLLADASGKKIGKTEGNVIALTAPPHELYGMIMNLPDDVIIKAFEYVTDVSLLDIKEMERKLKKGDNPMIYKKNLAFTLVKMLNSLKDAQGAQTYFEETFQKKLRSGNLPLLQVKNPLVARSLVNLLFELTLVSSKSEAKRLISEGAIDIDGQKINDINYTFLPRNGMVIRIGKHNLVKLRV